MFSSYNNSLPPGQVVTELFPDMADDMGNKASSDSLKGKTRAIMVETCLPWDDNVLRVLDTGNNYYFLRGTTPVKAGNLLVIERDGVSGHYKWPVWRVILENGQSEG